MFIDETNVHVKSGDGGNGAVARNVEAPAEEMSIHHAMAGKPVVPERSKRTNGGHSGQHLQGCASTMSQRDKSRARSLPVQVPAADHPACK